MVVNLKEMEELLAEERELLKSANMELGSMPEGYLSQVMRGGKMTYFHVVNDGGRRIRKSINGNRQIMGKLARKKYLETEILLLEKDIDLLEKLVGEYVDPAADEILRRVPGRFRLLPDEFFFPKHVQQGDTDAAWAANYRKSSYMAEKRTKTTSRGEKVRSMAEVAIAETYYKLGVPFRYDAEINIGRYTLSTDFLVKRPRDGKLIYHEHCGMTGNESYMRHHRWKLEQYESVGIVPWDNLLVTYNDAEGNFDLQRIEGEIACRVL